MCVCQSFRVAAHWQSHDKIELRKLVICAWQQANFWLHHILHAKQRCSLCRISDSACMCVSWCTWPTRFARWLASVAYPLMMKDFDLAGVWWCVQVIFQCNPPHSGQHTDDASSTWLERQTFHMGVPLVLGCFAPLKMETNKLVLKICTCKLVQNSLT